MLLRIPARDVNVRPDRYRPAVAMQQIVYSPLERPDVEVLVDGTWLPAEVRMATLLDDSSWEFSVAWHRDDNTYPDTFPGHQVRGDTVDRAGRRHRGPALGDAVCQRKAQANRDYHH